MRHLSYEVYRDKVCGCYIGKAVSGNMGAPLEGVKMPMELPYMPELVNPDLSNDDLDLQVLWLDVLEEKGLSFTSRDLQERFIRCCPYSPGEYAVMRKNGQRGIYPPVSGTFCNAYYPEGMGCPIRSEIWACIAPGDPALAAELAARDGVLDHGRESVYAEQFLAALESEAFFSSDLLHLIRTGLSVIPADSRVHRLAEDTVALCGRYADIKVVLTKLLFTYGHPDCTNLFQNIGITLAALLLGELDIIRTGMLALNCGFDTDCTCATAGAVVGLLQGAETLIRAYGLHKPTYRLGVESHRRSDLIPDLAEDIARMGVYVSGTREVTGMEGAPDVDYRFTPPAPLTLTVSYEGLPAIALGESKTVGLTVTSRYEEAQRLTCTVETVHGLRCEPAVFVCTVPANGTATVPVTVTIPPDTELVWDDNLLTVIARNSAGEECLRDVFGLAGAVPWKLCGPFWRTEPVSDTARIMETFDGRTFHYYSLLDRAATEGNRTDKMRQFHLNYAVDTETAYLDETALFAPLPRKWQHPRYEQRLCSIPEDRFTMEQLFGFQGPCVAYLSRIIVAEEEMTGCLLIGHSAPFSLYLNGERLARRDYCDNWTAENVHLDNVHLHKGDNRLLLRMTRANGDACFNVTFAHGMNCSAHWVGLCSRNPYAW